MTSNLDVNEQYDPVEDKWVKRGPMLGKRGGIVASSLNDSIYVLVVKSLQRPCTITSSIFHP